MFFVLRLLILFECFFSRSGILDGIINHAMPKCEESLCSFLLRWAFWCVLVVIRKKISEKKGKRIRHNLFYFIAFMFLGLPCLACFASWYYHFSVNLSFLEHGVCDLWLFRCLIADSLISWLFSFGIFI